MDGHLNHFVVSFKWTILIGIKVIWIFGRTDLQLEGDWSWSTGALPPDCSRCSRGEVQVTKGSNEKQRNQALLLQLNQSLSELKMLEHFWGQFELPLNFAEAWVHQIGKQDFITSGILSFSTGLHFTQSQLQLLPKDSCFWCGEQPFFSLIWSLRFILREVYCSFQCSHIFKFGSEVRSNSWLWQWIWQWS